MNAAVMFVLVAQTPTEANKIIVSSCYYFFLSGKGSVSLLKRPVQVLEMTDCWLRSLLTIQGILRFR